MGQSLVKIYVHIVFATKGREKLIDDYIETRLFGYIAELCNCQHGFAVAVGGHKNHIHILCEIPKTVPFSTFMQKIKGDSSHWIKSVHPRYKSFYWQDGFGTFSVSAGQVQNVKEYIDNQKQHHQYQSFEQEYTELLEEADIIYDEQYLWSDK